MIARPESTRALIALAMAFAVCAGFRAATARADARPATESAVAAFVQIGQVLQSPRCMNCHPKGDAPLNGDHAAPHRMNVSRRSSEAGLGCVTCHRDTNGETEHSPPGVPGWRLPPATTPMVFQGRSMHDLCEQLKDPARNGGKSLAALEEHLASDPLVLWGFRPGPGRTVPPSTHEELVARTKLWIAAGAPCPQ